MVRRSLPCFLFLLRDLLRSAPLLRSYRIRLSGICPASENRRLSEPERVPPLSMNAIKLSRPLIDDLPENTSYKHDFWIFAFLNLNRGGGGQLLKPYILKNHFSSLFFFHRIPRLFPGMPAAFKRIHIRISLFNEVPCHPGAGSLILSGSIKNQGLIFRVLLCPSLQRTGFFPNRIFDFAGTPPPGFSRANIDNNYIRVGKHLFGPFNGDAGHFN